MAGAQPHVTLPDAPLGVVGAGTMGAGIAQVAAVGGLDVKLFDAVDDAAAKAVVKIGEFLRRSVERGRITQDDAGAALQRIEPAGSLEELADCFIVIEAAPEDLAIKRDLFRQLSAICDPSTVLASNTSSIPITSIASPIARPQRVVGMHFFNPVPLMRLVEVVAGVNSSKTAIETARAVAVRMQREPILASDGPGFLVNRCSRPFLLEAQKLLQERIADHEQVDRVIRMSGAFRMGPFELSDLVGVDVGYDIARSFYALSHQEPRWQPSGIAALMVDAGKLGRKSRRGYYEYGEDGSYRAPDPPPQTPESASGSVLIIGDGELADQLRRLAEAAGHAVQEISDPAIKTSLVIDARHSGAGENLPDVDAPICVLCAGNSLSLAAKGRDIVGFHCLPPLGESQLIEMTRTAMTSDASAAAAAHFFHAIGKHVIWVGDAPGLVLGRIICQLINEAAFALQEGVGSTIDIDKGVKLGLNYPRGLFEWADLIGVDHVLATIDGLQREIGGDRYRAAPLLRRMVADRRLGRRSGVGFYKA